MNIVHGSVTMKRLIHAEAASISVYSNVVSKQNASYLINKAMQTMARSEITDEQTESDIRTSYGTFLDHGELAQVKQMRDMFERFCLIAGRPYDPTRMEALQILRYAPGQEYLPHHDFFDVKTKAGRAAIKENGQRVATLVVYLNDVESGGETIFPGVGNLAVEPVMGNAVHFAYPKKEEISLHGGNPVVAGTKWVATQWWTTNK